MREIKFRYRLKQLDPKKGYEEWFEFYTIEQIERGEVQTTAEIIGRDQYTGLKDKNSKEIYEGDIVFEPKMRKKAVVSWRNERATFWLTDGKEREILLMLENNRYEIIGNIYENPELIK